MLKFKCNQIHNYVLYTQAELLKHVKTIWIWLMKMIIWKIRGWSATTGTLIVIPPSPSSTAAVPFLRVSGMAVGTSQYGSPKPETAWWAASAARRETFQTAGMANGDFLKNAKHMIHTVLYICIYASKKKQFRAILGINTLEISWVSMMVRGNNNRICQVFRRGDIDTLTMQAFWNCKKTDGFRVRNLDSVLH